MIRRWSRHRETHFVDRVGWLRAAVLGANDGILSVASLITGVAASQADRHGVLVAGVAGWLAGAMSMAAGEYVSVSSQADSEKADLARERQELETMPEAELEIVPSRPGKHEPSLLGSPKTGHRLRVAERTG